MANRDAVPITIESILDEIGSSRKYADLCADTIRRAAAAALRTSPRRLSDATHYAKEKLHQWCGAYREGEVRKLERVLDEATFSSADDPDARSFALTAMMQHASTAERIPELPAIGAALREESAGAPAVIDLCGGANAFALPWIGLDPATRYRAFDVDGRFVSFVAKWLEKTGLGEIEHRDVLANPPEGRDAVAWLQKSAPCLERQEAGGVLRLLREIDARRVILTFPTKSLSGREKGMPENYAKVARELAEALGRSLRERGFESEIAFVLDRGGAA